MKQESSDLTVNYNKLRKQLNLIKETVSDKTYNLGSEFFTEVVLKLNDSLDADYTFIGKLNDTLDEIETIALCYKNAIQENFTYKLEDTPCELVIGEKVCSHPKGVTKIFPQDQLLIDMGIEAYVGVPLFNSKKHPTGILVSLFKKEIEDTDMLESVMLIFASRAGAELEHIENNMRLLESQNELQHKNEEYLSLNEEYLSLNEELENKNEELRKANSELQTSEEKFKMLFEYSGTANAFFNLEGKLIYQNTLSGKLLNGQTEDFIGKSLIQIFGETQGKIIEGRFNEIIKHPKTEVFESKFTLPSGNKWFKSIYQPVFNSANEISGLHIISQDITNEKIAEQKVFESSKKYSNLVEATTDLITIVDSNGIVTYVNHAAETIYGLKPEQCIGRPAFDFIHPEDRESTKQHFQQWLEQNTKHASYENRQLNVNGGYCHISWNILINRDENGDIVDLTSTGRDITNRKKLELDLIQAKEQAEKNENFLEKTGQMAKVGGWEIDLLTNKIIFSDETFRIHDLPLGETPTMEQSVLFYHPDDQPLITKLFQDALENGNSYDAKVKMITAKKRTIWVRIKGTPINANGKIVKVVGSIQNITETIEIEEQLKLAKLKAEESDRLKTAFLANMSHEIRTPMNGILGFTDLLLMPNLSDEKKQYYASIIKSSSQQLLNIISDIIDVSKIEAEEFTLSNTKFSIQEFLDEMIQQAKLLLQQKRKNNIEVKCSNNCTLKYAYLDKNRLAQIFLNLITNAIKFTNKGFIELQCNNVSDTQLQFMVKDTGRGIDATKHELIFERFRQAEDSDSFEGGTGLGLSICKALVERMGGEIAVHSKPQEGSIFSFTINNYEVGTKNNPVKDKKILPNKKVRTKLLIAEDEEINFLFFNEILANRNFEIIRAINGREAVDLFTAHNPDLVLLDIKMPELDGYGALEKIKEINSTTPIIAVTAFAMSGDEAKALEHGFSAYLSKPVSKDKLLAIIHKYS